MVGAAAGVVRKAVVRGTSCPWLVEDGPWPVPRSWRNGTPVGLSSAQRPRAALNNSAAPLCLFSGEGRPHASGLARSRVGLPVKNGPKRRRPMAAHPQRPGSTPLVSDSAAASNDPDPLFRTASRVRPGGSRVRQCGNKSVFAGVGPCPTAGTGTRRHRLTTSGADLSAGQPPVTASPCAAMSAGWTAAVLPTPRRVPTSCFRPWSPPCFRRSTAAPRQRPAGRPASAVRVPGERRSSSPLRQTCPFLPKCRGESTHQPRGLQSSSALARRMAAHPCGQNRRRRNVAAASLLPRTPASRRDVKPSRQAASRSAVSVVALRRLLFLFFSRTGPFAWARFVGWEVAGDRLDADSQQGGALLVPGPPCRGRRGAVRRPPPGDGLETCRAAGKPRTREVCGLEPGGPDGDLPRGGAPGRPASASFSRVVSAGGGRVGAVRPRARRQKTGGGESRCSATSEAAFFRRRRRGPGAGARAAPATSARCAPGHISPPSPRVVASVVPENRAPGPEFRGQVCASAGGTAVSSQEAARKPAANPRTINGRGAVAVLLRSPPRRRASRNSSLNRPTENGHRLARPPLSRGKAAAANQLPPRSGRPLPPTQGMGAVLGVRR